MTTKRNRPAGGTARRQERGNLQPHYTTRATPDSIPMRRADGRIVGHLDDDTLRKNAKREHMLRSPAGWAWDSAILEAAENAGARFTEIECDGLIYRSSIADFKRYGFPVNRGFGAQRGLPLTHWHVRRVGEPPLAVQMSLFEVGR